MRILTYINLYRFQIQFKIIYICDSSLIKRYNFYNQIYPLLLHKKTYFTILCYIFIALNVKIIMISLKFLQLYFSIIKCSIFAFFISKIDYKHILMPTFEEVQFFIQLGLSVWHSFLIFPNLLILEKDGNYFTKILFSTLHWTFGCGKCTD